MLKVSGDPFGCSVMFRRKDKMGLDPNSTEKLNVRVRVELETMTGVVGLLGGAVDVRGEGEGRKGAAVNPIAPH